MPTRRQVVAAAIAGTAIRPALGDWLIEALDLTRPDLRDVRDAVDRGDTAGARAAFARRLRERTAPKWLVDPANPPKTLSAAERASADAALGHTFVSVGIRHAFGATIDWSYNPTTQPGSPDAADHEWTWQLNRHPAWSHLAKAYNATSDLRYGRELASQVSGWIRDNPVPSGRPSQGPFSRWRTIEAGIRMFSSWPDVYHRMVRAPEAFPDDALLAMVECMARHADYLDANPTGGNWLCMEANGQYHVGVLFPEFRSSERWRNNALGRLRREIDAQVYPDGAQMELTPGYHNVALRNLVGALELARLNNAPLPDGYQAGLERMFDVNLRAMTPDRDVPPVNDSWHVDVRGVLRQGLALFPSRGDWKWVATDGKQGRAPVWPDAADAPLATAAGSASVLCRYAGWAVMRSGWDRDALFLMMDCGPFGMGHQHEDKLSFVLHAFGSRLVFDAGSYAYDASDMRRYVLSARGHNVVNVDGLEQNRRGGPRARFVLTKPDPIAWHTSRSVDYAAASYGTQREEVWGPPRARVCVHTRQVVFVKPLYWLVVDTLEPPDGVLHQYESTFHLDAPTAEIDPATGSIRARTAVGVSLSIVPAAGPQASVVSGRTEPSLQGWLPKAHGLTGADPRPCVVFSTRASGVVRLAYAFAPARAGQDCPVRAVRRIASSAGAPPALEVEERSGTLARLTINPDGSSALHRGRSVTALPPPGA